MHDMTCFYDYRMTPTEWNIFPYKWNNLHYLYIYRVHKKRKLKLNIKLPEHEIDTQYTSLEISQLYTKLKWVSNPPLLELGRNYKITFCQYTITFSEYKTSNNRLCWIKSFLLYFHNAQEQWVCNASKAFNKKKSLYLI